MKYTLVITSPSGNKTRKEVKNGEVIPVQPGDDVMVLDEAGNPADVSLRPEEEDLKIVFEGGEEVTLDDFYKLEGEGDPITVSITRPADVTEYEFNDASIGNGDFGGGFSLMRYSNVKYIGFDDNLGSSIGASAGSLGGGGAAPPEDAPELTPDTGSSMENGNTQVPVLGNDRDPEGGPLEVCAIGGIESIVGQPITLPSGATATLLEKGGIVDYVPGAAYEYLKEGETAVDVFTYTVCDAGGNTRTSTVTITITGENDGPKAVNDFGITDESSLVTIPLLTNDSDPDANDTLTVIHVEQPDMGTLILNPNGTVTFDPGDEFEYLGEGESATKTVNYTISDGNGGTDTAEISITVFGRK